MKEGATVLPQLPPVQSPAAGPSHQGGGLPPPKPVAEDAPGKRSMSVCDTGEPLPAKLTQALRDFSFIELHWFLPSTLLPPVMSLDECDHVKCCCRPTPAKRSRKTVADLATWQLCFNRYTAALCTIYPGMLPQMLAYANLIIQAQLQFNGDGWLTYDRMFRTAAATSGDTEWKKVDSSLYARFVSCQPRRSGICQVCCSPAHKSANCPWGVDDDVPQDQPVPTPGAWSPRAAQFGSPPPFAPPWPPICTSWNAGSCRFRGNCNFRHVCSFCLIPGHRNKECPTPPPSNRQMLWRAAQARPQDGGKSTFAPLSRS